jgi:aminoglycoside 6'-N-acetyltransferase
MDVSFRPLTEADLLLVHEWLGREHVQRWWGEPGDLDGTIEHYGPSLDGRDPTDLYAIVVDGRDAGMIQTYIVADYPEYAALIGVEENVAGLDLFLGEQALLGRGLGTEIIGRFVSEVVWARGETFACVADPDVDNVASLRAFEKAGFERVREFVDPEDGRLHALVRQNRIVSPAA